MQPPQLLWIRFSLFVCEISLKYLAQLMRFYLDNPFVQTMLFFLKSFVRGFRIFSQMSFVWIRLQIWVGLEFQPRAKARTKEDEVLLFLNWPPGDASAIGLAVAALETHCKRLVLWCHLLLRRLYHMGGRISQTRHRTCTPELSASQWIHMPHWWAQSDKKPVGLSNWWFRVVSAIDYLHSKCLLDACLSSNRQMKRMRTLLV